MANTFKENSSEGTGSFVSYSFKDFSSQVKTGGCPSRPKDPFVNGMARSTVSMQQPGEEKQAEEEHAEAVEQRVREAFAKGLDQGRSEVMVAFKEKVDQATFALKTAVEELSRVREEDVKRMEAETVRLSLAIVKKIIRTEAANGQVIAEVVKNAMQKVADPRFLTLRVNPKDVETLRTLNEGQAVDSEMPATLTLEEDGSILQGGCIIETKLGDVDARIDRQIRIIEEQLISHLPETQT